MCKIVGPKIWSVKCLTYFKFRSTRNLWSCCVTLWQTANHKMAFDFTPPELLFCFLLDYLTCDISTWSCLLLLNNCHWVGCFPSQAYLRRKIAVRKTNKKYSFFKQKKGLWTTTCFVYVLVGIIQTWGMFYSDLKVLETGGDSGRMVTWYSLIWKVVLKRNWKSRNVVEKRRTGGKTQSLKIHTRGKSPFILNVYTWKTISVNPFDVIFIIGKKWIIAKTGICTSKHTWVERKD